jgi:DNA polymerase
MVMSDLSGDPVVREAIMLRREGAKTSTAKFSKMLGCVCADGRLRGQFSYHGAGPGRWAGRLVQLQNLVRVDPDTEADAVNFVVSILSTPYSCEDAHNMIEMAGYQVMTVLAKAMRAMVCAEPMRKFFGGDFSNIEGRVNAWLAGQEDKLDAFRAYDAGTGPDLYKVTAAGILGLTPDTVSKIQRQTTGKVPELACGYQGGVQAFVKMAYTQNPPVKAEDMVPPVKAATPPDVWASMLECFPTARDRGDLQPDVWTAVKLAVTGWRKKNDKIVAGWWELQDAAIEAVSYPNNPIKVYNERVTYLCIDGWLLCQLPSGRVISYANPWIKRTVEQRVKYDGRWIDIQDFPSPPGMLADALWLQENGFEVSERVKNTVWFMGIDSETKQWVPKSLYGGLQCENIVQGFAADLLREAMKNVTTLEYDIVLHAHDELLSEVDEAYGSLDEYKMLMSIAPDCAAGLPLAVAVWEDVRYVK